MSSVVIVIIIIVVVIVIIAAIAGLSVSRRRQHQQEERQERAREEYGSEYERAVEERGGSEREAEKELRERRERLESEVRPLSEESRRRYDEQWRQVEQTFVDDPATSLDDADRVVAQILEERNFPVDSRQEASKSIGVMHPGVVEDFREAQRIHQDAAGSEGRADLEQMRQAIQRYRSVYERLTEE